MKAGTRIACCTHTSFVSILDLLREQRLQNLETYIQWDLILLQSKLWNKACRWQKEKQYSDPCSTIPYSVVTDLSPCSIPMSQEKTTSNTRHKLHSSSYILGLCSLCNSKVKQLSYYTESIEDLCEGWEWWELLLSLEQIAVSSIAWIFRIDFMILLFTEKTALHNCQSNNFGELKLYW